MISFLFVSCPNELVTYTTGTSGTIGPYEVGEIGPAGGYIFYDKGSFSDGWQYLEAAPSDIMLGIDEVLGSSDYDHVFGYYRTTEDGTSTLVGTATGIGNGEANTAALVLKMGSTAYTSSHSSTITTTGDYAARLCDNYEAGGYSDWFLPSKDELDLMYDNLKIQELGGFSNNYYWSSSEYDAYYAWGQDFYNGVQGFYNRYREAWVKPVRAF
jgi:hypothetical protein